MLYRADLAWNGFDVSEYVRALSFANQTKHCLDLVDRDLATTQSQVEASVGSARALSRYQNFKYMEHKDLPMKLPRTTGSRLETRTSYASESRGLALRRYDYVRDRRWDRQRLRQLS